VRELLPVRTGLEVGLPAETTTKALRQLRRALARMSDRLAEAHLR
jgi:hypothetical protein